MAEDFQIRPVPGEGLLGLWYLPEPGWRPLVFSWDKGAFYRRIIQTSRKDLLFRALAGRPGEPLRVLDLTLGLGLDAHSLLRAGCEVIGVERNPSLLALWRDALQRYGTSPEWKPVLQKFTLAEGDARELCAVWAGRADVIYLDPMHEEKRDARSAPRREMRIIRKLVGHDLDSAALLDVARSSGKRVVVKRPDKAPPLGGMEPHHSLRGSTVRFDVYERDAIIRA